MRARYRLAMSTWRTAADLVALLNECWGGPVSGLGGGSCSGGLPIDGPSPCRIWASEAPARRKRAWASVCCAVKGLDSALRLSHSESGTGEELWSKLRKAASDISGRTPGREVYRPFVSANVKEGKPGAQEIDGLKHWPPEVSQMFSSPKNCLRKISGEGQAIFDDLCKRYNHFGGEAQEEWIAYHSFSESNG